MAGSYKGLIVYKGVTKGVGKVSVVDYAESPALDDDALETLQGVIDAHTACVATSRNFMVVTKLIPAADPTGIVDRKGVLVAQEENGRTHKWMIPGIILNDCESVPNTDGERIKPAVAQTLADAFGAALGITLIALECPVIQHS